MTGLASTCAPATFAPVFVVGSERSGTTLLAVLLGRHSMLAMTPETHFFCLVSKDRPAAPPTHEELLQRFRTNRTPKALELNTEQLEARFTRGPATCAALFRAILEQFAADQCKARPGEKTPLHLHNVPTILEWFPDARIVCIVRDGRDVVLSTASMPWSKERRLRHLCWRWIKEQRVADRWLAAYPRRFARIRYEDLLRDPEGVLRRVDAFADLPYEPGQLDPGADPNIVDAGREPWKSDALREIDPSRIAGWKKKASPEQVRIMNAMMGSELRKHGYEDTGTPRLLGDALAAFWFRSGLSILWSRAIEKHFPSRRAARRAARLRRRRVG